MVEYITIRLINEEVGVDYYGDTLKMRPNAAIERNAMKIRSANRREPLMIAYAHYSAARRLRRKLRFLILSVPHIAEPCHTSVSI